MSGPNLTVAVMQPYFLPYAGYFRLFSHADLFVIYDCVQFPRRGYVHRNKLIDRAGNLRWVSLPIAHCPMDTRIDNLAFAEDCMPRWLDLLAAFPTPAQDSVTSALFEAMQDLSGTPVDYIVGLMESCCSILDLPWNVLRSSELGLPETLRGQDRILAIAKAVGATRYINAPGGIDLYDPLAFSKAGLELCFLTPYDGPKPSIFQRLCDEPLQSLRSEFDRVSLAV